MRSKFINEFKLPLLHSKFFYKNVTSYYNFNNPAICYSVRTFYFFKLINYFKFYGFNVSLLLKIFNNECSNVWFLFLTNYSTDLYVSLCLKLHFYYNYCLTNSKYFDVKTTRYTIKPSSFLVYNELGKNDKKIAYNGLRIFLKSFNCHNYITKDIFYPRFSQLPKLFSVNTDDEFCNPFIISFLRVQRRYNKRRYSRVRIYSRSPFFSGISLSSLLVSSFFNSNIKNVDWVTSLPVVIDINFILFIFLVYFIFRLWKLFIISPLFRSRYRIHITKVFNKFFKNNWLKKFFIK